MREGAEIRESGFVERSDHGDSGSYAIEQPHRVSLSLATDNAPMQPGAYRFWDSSDKVLYVGKALNLRHRIRSHLSTFDESSRHRLMISRSTTVDWIVTPNDVEALLLEDMLIKRHRPAFNVRFRDDKRYPILRLDVNDQFPTLTVVRQFQNDGALYFGPYTSSKTMRAIIRVVERYFSLRRCQGEPGHQNRECINFQMHKCPGVCQNRIKSVEYRETVSQVQLLLAGRNDELTHRLESEMITFSESLNFEAAAIRRDQLEAVRNVSGGRKLLMSRPVDLDVFAFETTQISGYAEILLVRSGMLSGNVHLQLNYDQPIAIDKVAEHLMIHYYRQNPPIPNAIVSNCIPASSETIESFLKQACGRRVKIHSNSRGIRSKLVSLAHANLTLFKKSSETIRPVSEGSEALRKVLNLVSLPRRIEAIDISENQGKHAVGSLVSFLDGKPQKSRYRRYKIQSKSLKSDLDRIREVLTRRFRRVSLAGWELPDILLVDGGLLQLNAALATLAEYRIDNLVVISLAKQRNGREFEGIFLRTGEEITLAPEHPALRFLDRIRDEAHRFAITYHRSIRDKNSLQSALHKLTGIGPVRMKRLVSHFGSILEVRNADVSAIARIPGFGKRSAQAIKLSLEKLTTETYNLEKHSD